MAFTASAWSVGSMKVAGKDVLVLECDLAIDATGTVNDAYTKPIPHIDPLRPFTLFVNTDGETLDASALPVDLWGGFSTEFVLAGDGATVAATDGTLLKAGLIANANIPASAKYDPVENTAHPMAPIYALNLNGASTLNTNVNCHIVIVQ